jgi:cis-L-3-hydroxyproline dehydratase
MIDERLGGVNPMKLDSLQEAISRGSEGGALALAMRTLVSYGEAFGAGRLVPIKSAHLAGSFGSRTFSAYYEILGRIASEGKKVRVPTTVNPRPGRDLSFLNRKVVFKKQDLLEELLGKAGVTPNWSCACYDGENVPGLGDAVAWAESSAVQYANSVLGARTNRNSILVDICSALTGLTPEFGYLLEGNRRGRVLVKLKVDRMDASALGYLVGEKAVDRVPVIEHWPFGTIELKNMGGAMAAAGAVALFHVEGLTPEAPDLKTAFDGEPEAVITISQSDLDALASPDPSKADLVVFGCPHMTFEEAEALAARFIGRRATRPVWFCMKPDALRRFRETGLEEKTEAAGVRSLDVCPLAALTMSPGKRRVLTSSGKLYYYLAKAGYGSEASCLEACGAGS